MEKCTVCWLGFCGCIHKIVAYDFENFCEFVYSNDKKTQTRLRTNLHIKPFKCPKVACIIDYRSATWHNATAVGLGPLFVPSVYGYVCLYEPETLSSLLSRVRGDGLNKLLKSLRGDMTTPATSLRVSNAFCAAAREKRRAHTFNESNIITVFCVHYSPDETTVLLFLGQTLAIHAYFFVQYVLSPT